MEAGKPQGPGSAGKIWLDGSSSQRAASLYIIVCHHRRRHQGKGYPQGLEIPSLVRITALADASHVITGKRLLPRGLGAQFNSEMTEVFLRFLERRG